jgi:hypothetical protein
MAHGDRALLGAVFALCVGLCVALSGCAQPHEPHHSAQAAAQPTTAQPTTAPATPAPATSAPATSPLPSLTVGATFDEQCAIAWPTEPVVSATNIQLTLNCANVPTAQYVFVVAVYDDPTLRVTHADASAHVTGTVTDTAMTSAGVSYLIVTATAVEL